MFPLIVSVLAPVVSCIQMLPQIRKVIKSKNVRDISFYSLLLLLFSNFLWLLHGYFVMDLSILFSEVVAVLVNLFLLGLFFNHHKKHHKIS